MFMVLASVVTNDDRNSFIIQATDKEFLIFSEVSAPLYIMVGEHCKAALFFDHTGV